MCPVLLLAAKFCDFTGSLLDFPAACKELCLRKKKKKFSFKNRSVTLAGEKKKERTEKPGPGCIIIVQKADKNV